MTTADKILTTSDEEFEFREALSLVLTGRESDGAVDDLNRDIVVTAYDGAYGQAGVVLAINGSPPVALLLVVTDKMDKTVFVFRRPYRPGPVIEIADPSGYTRVSKKKARLHRAVTAYLKTVGVDLGR